MRLKTNIYSAIRLALRSKSLAFADSPSDLASGGEQEVGNDIWPTLEGV